MNREANSGTYVCSGCGGEFTKPPGRDELAHKEAETLWGKDGHADDMVVVCDDCFKEFMKWYSADHKGAES